MSVQKCRRLKSCVLALSTLLCAPAHGEPWYGAACPQTSVSVVPLPPIAQEQLVRARLSPLDAGQDIAVRITPDGQFWALRESFEQWQLPLPAQSQDIDGTRWYALEQLAGLQYRFDACTQELWIDVSGVAGVHHDFDFGRGGGTSITAVSEPGGHLNIDAQYLQDRTQQQVSGTAELGLFSAQGHGTASMLYDGARAVRLDTSWSRDWPQRAERLTIGDAIARGGQVGQALRFGGVQWGTDFSLQPDVVTFPLPTLGGQAALPSTVDVYVNQVLRAQQQVPAGSFELNDVPVVTGAGNVQLVVRDLLGRTQVISYPFYVAPALLRAGLREYAVQAGALREGYGLRSGGYEQAFASGRLREGLDDTATYEVYGEASADQQMGGIGLSRLALPATTWNASVAMSHAAGPGVGAYAAGGIDYTQPRWNAGAQFKLATLRYAQLGEPVGSLRAQWIARVGVRAGSDGMINLSYLDDRRRDRAGSAILGLNYGTRLVAQWFATAGLTRIFDADGGLGGLVAVSCAFGGDKTFSVQETRGPGDVELHRASVQRDPAAALGFGYRLATEQGSDARNTVNTRWSGQKGVVTADAETLNGDNGLRLGVASGFAWLGRDGFWTRPVDASFAVVDSGVPGARVYQENRDAGLADEKGLLLVPGLRAYERNSLRIEDADLPLRYSARTLGTVVVPPAESGVRAPILVVDVPTLSVHLRQADGAAVMLGATLELDGRALPLPVGYEGQALIEAAPGRHSLRVRWPQGTCAAMVTIPQDAGADLPPVDVECR